MTKLTRDLGRYFIRNAEEEIAAIQRRLPRDISHAGWLITVSIPADKLKIQNLKREVRRLKERLGK